MHLCLSLLSDYLFSSFRVVRFREVSDIRLFLLDARLQGTRRSMRMRMVEFYRRVEGRLDGSFWVTLWLWGECVPLFCTRALYFSPTSTINQHPFEATFVCVLAQDNVL